MGVSVAVSGAAVIVLVSNFVVSVVAVVELTISLAAFVSVFSVFAVVVVILLVIRRLLNVHGHVHRGGENGQTRMVTTTIGSATYTGTVEAGIKQIGTGSLVTDAAMAAESGRATVSGAGTLIVAARSTALAF